LVAFVAITNAARIWVRALDSLTARELPGTEEARNPFWSPDSRSIAFFASGKLKRVDLDAGSPVEIAEFQAARGGSWSSNGTILFNPLAPDALVQVSATGGTPTQLTHPDEANGEISHRYPDFLPDGKRFIFFVRSHNPHSNGIYLSSLDHPDTKTMLVESTSPGVYAVPHGKHPGYLLWLRQDTLTAQPFDPESARLSGEPRVVPSVANVAFNSGFSLAAFSVAQDGKLLYASGSDRYQMTWYSREGKVLGTVGEPDRYVDIRISPNGKQVVSAIDSPTGPYLWLRDFSSDRQTRLIFDIPTYVAAWSPDGRRVAYHGLVKRQLFESPTDGSGRQEAVMQSPRNVFINDWSPDGRSILYNEISPKARLELWVLTNVDDIRQRKAVPLLQTAFNESPATFSTDGKWIAYTSDRSGRKDIYVQQFTVGSGNSARTWLVSNAGGNYPRWRRDGKELFYQALNGKLMVIPVRAGTEGLEFGNPTALFSIVGPLGMVSYNYDVAPDGRILVLAPSGGGTSLTLLTNWQAAVNK
jgi:Tol biopolymer transport system component